MCGIIYVRHASAAPVNTLVASHYNYQKTRGRSGFGYVAIREDNTITVERAETEKGILAKLHTEPSHEILFHHRLPTSTPNVLDSTHPIVVRHDTLRYDYYIVHNGIIGNAHDLKRDHEKQGFTYSTAMTEKLLTKNHTYTSHYFNDSEALAIDLALTIEGRQETMVSEGSIAFIALSVCKKTNKPVRLLYGRNAGSPLTTERTGTSVAIASEGGKVSLRPDVLYAYSYATGHVTEQAQPIGKTIYNGLQGEFSWAQDDDEDGFWYEDMEQLQDQQDEIANMIVIAEQTGDSEEEADLWEQYSAIDERL